MYSSFFNWKLIYALDKKNENGILEGFINN